MKTILALLLSTSLVSAADLKLALKAPALAQPTCTVTMCSGWFGGFNITGVGSNLDILGSGINNSVFAGGGALGVNGGYQFWNGSLFFAGEVMGDYDFQQPGLVDSSKNRFFAAGLVKAGVGLGNLIGIGNPGTVGAGTPSQGPINLAIVPGTAMLSPYVLTGGAFRNGRQGWVTGAGTEFIISQGWNLDVSYMHINYNAGDTTVIPGAVVNQNDTENLVQVALKRMF